MPIAYESHRGRTDESLPCTRAAEGARESAIAHCARESLRAHETLRRKRVARAHESFREFLSCLGLKMEGSLSCDTLYSSPLFSPPSTILKVQLVSFPRDHYSEAQYACVYRISYAYVTSVNIFMLMPICLCLCLCHKCEPAFRLTGLRISRPSRIDWPRILIWSFPDSSD